MKRMSLAGVALLGLSLVSPLIGDNVPSRFLNANPYIKYTPVADNSAPAMNSTSNMNSSVNGVMDDQKNPATYMNSETKNLIEKAKDNPNLSTFISALKAAGLTDTLANGGPYTIFAPSNDAFNQLPKGVLDKLLQNKKDLVSILSYHVVPGQILSKDAKTMKIRTLNGQDLNLESVGGLITVDDAEVIQPDLKAKNGVIHVIDEVISPPAK